jgi:hypothetical protein
MVFPLPFIVNFSLSRATAILYIKSLPKKRNCDTPQKEQTVTTSS